MSAPSPRHVSPHSSSPIPPPTSGSPLRPSPARAATLSTYSYKTRAASQPAGDRVPIPGSQPHSGRGSPGVNGSSGPYGVIGGSRTPGRFAGALASGTTTRANSFSAGELREPRNPSLTRTLSSHAEELPSRSQSTSPYPTFSPSSSPSTSPATLMQQPRSPPKAEANVSRSRSQSLAGPRPGERPWPMSSLDAGSVPRTFDKGWDISPEGGNVSPFARHVPTFNPASQPLNRFRPPEYLRTTWGSSAPEAALNSSFALGGGVQPYNTIVGGFDSNGGKSGTSSRRHSVSVVAGGRRDFTFGDGAGITSPGRGIGPLGFSDEELLPERLGNALSLEIDQSRRRGIDIEIKSPQSRDVHASSLPKFAPAGDRGSAFSRSKDPFAPEGPFGFGTPPRGRLETLQPAAERAHSGESKDSQRSRFSFDNSALAGSPARNQNGGIHDAPQDRRGPALAPAPIGAVGTMPRGPGAIGGPAQLDPRFMPFYPSRPPYAGPPSPVSAGFPGAYARPPPGSFYQTRPPPTVSPFSPGYAPQPPFSPQGAAMPSYFPPPGSPHAPTSPSFSSLSLADLGKGVPLATIPPTTPLYIVTFKAGRRDVYYCPDPTLLISNGDRVIVEADRGSDLGTVVYDQLTPIDVRDWQEKQATAALLSGASQHQPPGMAVSGQPTSKSQPRVTAGELAGADLSTLLAGVGPGGSQLEGTTVRGPLAKEITPKRIFAKSAQGPEEQARMIEKQRDEYEAMMICREKVAQRGLPMQIVDAEYQWDRRKLTFYFKAEKRVDFRDLTKENFRIFKSRIWMSMVPKDDPRG